jgi:hypothetical protein
MVGNRKAVASEQKSAAKGNPYSEEYEVARVLGQRKISLGN